jgi:hypothetical protein
MHLLTRKEWSFISAPVMYSHCEYPFQVNYPDWRLVRPGIELEMKPLALVMSKHFDDAQEEILHGHRVNVARDGESGAIAVGPTSKVEQRHL